MSNPVVPQFGRGGEAATEAAEASRGGGGFRKTVYFPPEKMKNGDTIVLRYLTDSPQWYYVQSHPGAPTKPAPADWPSERTWPVSMPAVCRHDSAFKNAGMYGDCYICDNNLTDTWGKPCKPKVRVYALAVVREEVIGTQAMVDAGQIPQEKVDRRLGYRDKMRDVEVPKRDDKGEVIKEGDKILTETVTEPSIIVINQSTNVFFDALQGLYTLSGQINSDGVPTICDRDYLVRKTGEGKDTQYQQIALEPIPDLKPGLPGWKRYEDAIAAQGESVDIGAILTERSSDEFFARFFDPTKTVDAKGGVAAGAPASAPVQQQSAAPSSDVSPDRLQEMKNRIQGNVPVAAPAAAEAPAASNAPVDFNN